MEEYCLCSIQQPRKDRTNGSIMLLRALCKTYSLRKCLSLSKKRSSLISKDKKPTRHHSKYKNPCKQKRNKFQPSPLSNKANTEKTLASNSHSLDNPRAQVQCTSKIERIYTNSTNNFSWTVKSCVTQRIKSQTLAHFILSGPMMIKSCSNA